ncbi:MAG: PRC-barrel domain-containing protein [Candidatus Micrarchaeia archaeon]
MTILMSDLYGKQIITNSGKKIGLVEDIILDFDSKVVSNLLLTKLDNLIRSQHTASVFAKNSIKFDRVKSISETIIISAAQNPVR